ncbi:MAG: hypothetical protein FJ220_02090 [Kiritimatiellaceae bacterium]|nr:hypothetical protein [Kiritimatiellaceae bacterium]
MKTALWISFALNIVLALVSFLVSPGEVAIHFSTNGKPDDWAPSYVNTLITLGMNLILFVSFYLVPQLIHKTSARWISLPNKTYWLSPEHRARTNALVTQQMQQYGTFTFLFMLIVGLLALQANLSDPVRFREDLFWPPFGIYMAYTIFWTVRLCWIFRLPKANKAPARSI